MHNYFKNKTFIILACTALLSALFSTSAAGKEGGTNIIILYDSSPEKQPNTLHGYLICRGEQGRDCEGAQEAKTAERKISARRVGGKDRPNSNKYIAWVSLCRKRVMQTGHWMLGVMAFNVNGRNKRLNMADAHCSMHMAQKIYCNVNVNSPASDIFPSPGLCRISGN